jgi:hypothetical protein
VIVPAVARLLRIAGMTVTEGVVTEALPPVPLQVSVYV